jgi:hypothetical protein
MKKAIKLSVITKKYENKHHYLPPSQDDTVEIKSSIIETT